jgi:hypothetical protein
MDVIDTSGTAIVSMSMSQHITSMAPSAGDEDTIDDVIPSLTATLSPQATTYCRYLALEDVAVPQLAA